MAEVMNAVHDGARLLDEVEGTGTSEVWTNMCLEQGGLVFALPWIFLLAYPHPEDERELYVAYTYGDVASLARVSRLVYETGRFERLSFRRGFRSERPEEERRVYDFRLFTERLERMGGVR